MGQVNYKIPRVTDEQIHRSLITLANEFGSFQVGVQVGDTHIGQVTFPLASEPNWVAVLAEQSELIFHFSGVVAGVSLAYYRGGAQGALWDKSPVLDDLAIDTQGFDPARVKVSARVLDLFRPVQLPRPADPAALLESQRHLQEASFARLQLQLEKVFEQTIDLRAQLDEQVRQKHDQLEAEFKQRELEAAQRIDKRAEEVAAKQRELDERSKLLDESDNTFARRQIRDRMLSDVATRVQNFGLSQATVAARRPVAGGIAVLCLFLFMLLAWTSFELYVARRQPLQQSRHVAAEASAARSPASDPASSAASQAPPSAQLEVAAVLVSDTERILLWIRFALLSIGSAASILYYIRWQNSWASTFATTEQSLQQFHIDVNRANWVVETCLEWRKETESDIPAPLIESLTRGLFAGREASPTVLHPADELASALMGSASKLSLDINGNKLDIDKPGKIPKSVPASQTGAA